MEPIQNLMACVRNCRISSTVIYVETYTTPGGLLLGYTEYDYTGDELQGNTTQYILTISHNG